MIKSALHQQTPSVVVTDNRGCFVREIAYVRHPDTPDNTQERITRHQYDVYGALLSSIDPRLHGLQQTDATITANISYLRSLSGQPVHVRSVDAGSSLALNDIAGRPHAAFVAAGTDDAVRRHWQYEETTLPGRLLAVSEQAKDAIPRTMERLVWAAHSQQEMDDNVAGQCIRHYDPAGVTRVDSVALNGALTSSTRQLLPDTTEADWYGEVESSWEGQLDAASLYIQQSTADATGNILTTTDAVGNVQRIAYDIAGMLVGSWLTPAGEKEQAVIVSLTYSAAGQRLREEHGNGVVTTYTYEPETQRVVSIKTERPAGHPSGVKVLQDLRYEYDPVGNVLSVSNEAEEARFWRNQKVVPKNTYYYDSLYQLVKATGREIASRGQQDSSLPTPLPLPTDSVAYTNYTRLYLYDIAGNLTQIQHSAPASGNNYTTMLTVSERTNRAVVSALADNATQVDALFSAGGHQRQLLPGQSLVWTPRGELQRVSPVIRTGDVDDQERYRYSADSQRVVKVSTQKAAGSVQTQRVVYLPGLEVRTRSNGNNISEALHVLTVGESGRASVRVLQWEAGKPADMSNNAFRYSYGDLVGSCGLEIDGDGNIISQEEYYPYGGTAVWAARSQREADYKTVRYSGKERDATGLYYYGYRYYQPWAGRWLSADPAGTVDGLNLFRMVRNNPVTLHDPVGHAPDDPNEMSDWMLDIVNTLASKKNSTPRHRDNYINSVRSAISNIYIASSEYFNAYSRGINNPAYEQMPEILPKKEADDIVRTYREQSNAAAYDWGYDIKADLDAMRQVLAKERNVVYSELILQLKRNAKVHRTYRGNKVSQSTHAALQHYANSGSAVRLDQFMSTSESISVAASFASGQFDSADSAERPIMYLVEGSSGAGIQAWLEEHEVVYPPDTWFRITHAGIMEKTSMTVLSPSSWKYKLTEIHDDDRKNMMPEHIPYLTDYKKIKSAN